MTAFCAVLISSRFSLFYLHYLIPSTSHSPSFFISLMHISELGVSLPTSGLRFCIHVLTIPTFQPSLLSVAAFAGVHCKAEVLAQHLRGCHPFSVLLDQDLLKLSHLGEFYRDVKQRAEAIPLCSVCAVVRAGSSPCSSACQGQGLHCSSSSSLPSSEVSVAAEVAGLLGWEELWGQALPSITLLLNQHLSCCSLQKMEVGWLGWVQDIPLDFLPTKTVLGLTDLIFKWISS